jgi:GDP-L-fucose synthase
MHVTRNFTVTPGVRFESYEVEIDQIFRGDLTEDLEDASTRIDEVLPGIAMAWEFMPRTTLYGGYHRGIGPHNVAEGAFPALVDIGDNFEVGLRSTALTGLTFDIAYFHSFIEDYQIKEGFTDDNGNSIYGVLDEVQFNGVELAVRAYLAAVKPDVIVVAAATVGGILANSTRPAEFIYDNLMIEANLIEAAHRSDVERVVFLGSSCIYPKHAPQPMPEDCLLTGPLEPTNQWYAIAKIAGIKLAQAYREQYGRRYISIMPTNLYGIGDYFNLDGAHVIPALMRKAHEAKMAGTEELLVWGTGTVRREFLYVDDLADAVVFLTRAYDAPEPINVGVGEDVTIRDLALLVAEVVGFTGRLAFDATKPDGTPRKLLDVSRLSALGWRARTSLRDGLVQTYDWYLANEADLRR